MAMLGCGLHVGPGMRNIFRQWAYPERMRLDNGQPFASAEFKNYASAKNLKLKFAIPLWPQQNGVAPERQNRGVVRALRIGKVERVKWLEVIQSYVYAYNIRPNSMTGKTPLPSMRAASGYENDEEVRIRDKLAKESEGRMQINVAEPNLQKFSAATKCL